MVPSARSPERKGVKEANKDRNNGTVFMVSSQYAANYGHHERKPVGEHEPFVESAGEHCKSCNAKSNNSESRHWVGNVRFCVSNCAHGKDVQGHPGEQNLYSRVGNGQ